LRNLEKSGGPEKKVVLYHKSTIFQIGEKWLARKKSELAEPLFKNHFSRKVVADYMIRNGFWGL